MEQQSFKCSGDCLKCSPIQRQYCSSQFSYNSMRMIEDVQTSLSAMQGTIEELKVKIDAIQGNEASLFDPTAVDDDLDHIQAQEGDGAGE